MAYSWHLQGEHAIEIWRDDQGVLHVAAETEPDLYRGLGFCHAHDRSVQLLLARILGSGRACELLRDDDEAFELDRFFRRLDFACEAQAEAKRCSEETANCLQAYCDGINEELAGRAPWELRLLGYRPEPWTAGDSILVTRLAGYVGLAQSQGDMEHALVEMVQAGVPRAHLEELFRDGLQGLDEELLRRTHAPTRIVPEHLSWTSGLIRATASNNWVIAPRKTASGRAILANDPHLEGNRLPSVWHEVVLEWRDQWRICATMPGMPFAAIVRGNELAWGVTYAGIDGIDSWVEDCRNGCYRRIENGVDDWQPFTARRELIKRRRNADVEVVFHENDHGVLDGDPHVAGLYLCSRWASGRGAGARSLDAARLMLHQSCVPDAMDLIGGVESGWNWVLADGAGNIGYQMSGLVPRRRQGVSGVVPLAGWLAENDWQGFADVHELPRELNPERGFIVTANEDRNDLGECSPISIAMGSERADRIAELLGERDDWDVAAVQAVQMDVYSIQAERFMEVLEPLLPTGEAADVLRRWDRRYESGSRGAALFERFYRALIQEVLGGVCGHEVVRHICEETVVTAMLYANIDGVVLNPSSVWYGEEGRDRVIARVAKRVLAEPLPVPGNERRMMMKHLLFGGLLPAWLGFDYGPIDIRGSRATIHQGQVFTYAGRKTTFMPSYRMVTDFAHSEAFTCLLGGPSDRRFSRWYTTGIDDFLEGRFKRLRARATSKSEG